MSANRNLNMYQPERNENEVNLNILHPNNEFLVPQANWVYTTPPLQKPRRLQLKGCSIQTAYRCDNREMEMFELKPNIHVDFSKLGDMNEIHYDPRYMRHVLFEETRETGQEYQTVLEPSRKTKFVSRTQRGQVSEESTKKLKRNLFDIDTA